MIRKANKFDVSFIVEILKNYRDAAPHKILNKANNKEYIEKLLFNLIVGAGFILLAEKDNKIIGVIIAAIIPNIWNPKVQQCSEIAYWVEPEFRGGTAAYRLIKSYINECNKMMESDKIQMYTMSKMVNSPDLKYEKFGLSKLEETWVK
jgi:N-acetylglutamate synthase-like GNAT family acetyltransferase